MGRCVKIWNFSLSYPMLQSCCVNVRIFMKVATRLVHGIIFHFKLPSACECNYKGRFGLGFRGAFEIPASKQPPKCTSDKATKHLEEIDVPIEKQVIFT